MSNASVPVVRLWEDAVVTIPKGPYPYSGFQTFGLAILVFFPLLSLVVCGFRIYSRILVSGFGLGEYPETHYPYSSWGSRPTNTA